MTDISLYILVPLTIVGLTWLQILQPRNQVLVAFLVLSSLFDLVPRIVYGFYVRDAGFVLMFVAWIRLLFHRRVTRIPGAAFVWAVYALVIWGALSMLYGILENGYPLLHTFKAARQWILGYATFVVFLRLYETDQGAFLHIVKWVYRITYVLVPLTLVQYTTGVQIFFGSIVEYGGAVRALPIFLPICLMLTWYILIRLLSGQLIMWQEKLYVVLVMIMTAVTYTRGIYLAFVVVFSLMVVLLARSRRLILQRVFGYLIGGTLVLAVLLVSGGMDRVLNRFMSGLGIVSGVQTTKTYVDDADTFTGRLMLVGERFAMVAKENPLVGFAFIHESLVSAKVRAGLQYGGPIATPEYQKMYANGMPYVTSLHQVDIGWSDLVVDMGFPALLLMLVVMGGVVKHQLATVLFQVDATAYYFWATALFLQLCMMMLLMFNGNPYVHNVHIACFMLASFVFCSREVLVG